MRSDADDDYGAQHDGNEIVAFGARSDRSRQWLSRLLVACFVIAVVVGLIVKSTNHKSQPQPQSHPLPAQQVASSKPPTVVNVGHPLLGVNAGWELFARGPDELVAIQMARGLITETSVPVLQTSRSDVSFVVGPHEAIVRSPDNVPGYLIPDGRPAQLITGPFANGGVLIPGPKPDQAWVMSGTSGQPTATLVTLAGTPAGETIRFNPRKELATEAAPDGHGYLLVLANPPSGFYDVGPTFVNRIPDHVIAVGPTGWLVLACHRKHCNNTVINPATHSHRVLPGRAIRNSAWSWPTLGAVSPDGSTAAVLDTKNPSRLSLRLVNLQSGAVASVDVTIDPSAPNECLAWSPDSEWLFIATAQGKLVAVNAATRRVQGLGIQLPHITQLAVRPAAG